MIVIDSGLSVRARPFFCSVTLPPSILFSHSRAIISQKLPMCTSPTLYLDLGGGGDPAPQRCREREFFMGWAAIDGDSLFVVFRLVLYLVRIHWHPVTRSWGGRGLGRKGAKGKGGVGVATESFRSESCRRAFPNPYGPHAVNK